MQKIKQIIRNILIYEPKHNSAKNDFLNFSDMFFIFAVFFRILQQFSKLFYSNLGSVEINKSSKNSKNAKNRDCN